MNALDDRLLFCNDAFAVINKVAGEICSSDEGEIDEQFYVPEIFRPEIEKKLSRKPDVIECVNRIDRPVSGIVLLALTEESDRILKGIFNNKEKVDKRYWTIVEGVSEKTDIPVTLKDYLYFNPSKKKTFICGKEHRKSKYAELFYQVMGNGERYSYLEVQLVTGRTHQIRAQLANQKMHIKGDVKYGARRADTLPGIRLHAARLEFTYPGEGRYVFFAPIPETDALWNDALHFLSAETSALLQNGKCHK